MIYLLDTEWTLGWTRSSKCDSHRKMTELCTAKAYPCQSTWKKIQSLNSPSCTNTGLSQSYPSQNMQVPFLRSENPMENYVSLWTLGRSTPWLQMIILTIITQSALCQTQHNTWQGNPCSANLTALKLITVWRWRTNGQWKCLLSILLAELLPIRHLHKASADLCLLFQASCASTWTQLSRLTNVLNTCMILESQPITLRTSAGTFAQSSSAFAMQDWNWRSKKATLESGNLNFWEEPFRPKDYHHNLTKFRTS